MTPVFRLYICLFCTFGVVFGDYDWNTNPGNGTAGNPYQISTAAQLAAIGSNAALLDKHFILTADINMGAYTFGNSPIAPDTDQTNQSYTGENTFTGLLDGQGHRILNLKITRTGTSFNIGLIGIAQSPWQVRNLGLEEIRISVGNSSNHIGGIVGAGFSGTVSSCYVTGSITGGTSCSYMGGFGGQCNATIISNSCADCDITNGTGSTLTGGAIGYMAASTTLEKCYSIGSVESAGTGATIGALVGRIYTNGGQAINCYFLAGVGPNNSIGTPKLERELKNIATFDNWEFNRADFGNDGYWRMRSDMPHYPYLAWEFKPEDFYGDFKIDMKDFTELAGSWKSNSASVEFNWLCDLNGNLVIEVGDLRAFCTEWLQSY